MKDFNLNLSDESLEFLKTNFYSLTIKVLEVVAMSGIG